MEEGNPHPKGPPDSSIGLTQELSEPNYEVFMRIIHYVRWSTKSMAIGGRSKLQKGNRVEQKVPTSSP